MNLTQWTKLFLIELKNQKMDCDSDLILEFYLDGLTPRDAVETLASPMYMNRVLLIDE